MYEFYFNKAALKKKKKVFRVLKPYPWKHGILGKPGAPFETELRYAENLLPILFPKLRDAAAATAKSLQSCLTLCNPTDGSPPGSAVPGILQTKTLQWVAISFSNA